MTDSLSRRLTGYALNGVYALAIVTVLPVVLWRWAARGRYRQGVWQKLTGRLRISAPTSGISTQKAQGSSDEVVSTRRSDEQTRRIWCHAVSLGEVQVLAQLMSKLRDATSGQPFVVTTGTDTGYEVACRRFRDDTVRFAPLDFTWAVSQAFDRIQPVALLLTELELWPNLIFEAERRRIPVAVVNARLSEKSSLGYERAGWLTRPMFASLTFVGCQTEADREGFLRLGVRPEAAVTTGSLKFDSAEPARERTRTEKLSALMGLLPSQSVFLAGSTSDPEEEIVLRTFTSLAATYPQLRLVLVPRHPERCDEIARRLASSPFSFVRRSRIQDAGSAAGARIILVDVVGELSAWWTIADIGFVGGSLGSRGGQNMIEPAASGVATCFGPNTRNFRHVVRLLLAANAAEVVHDHTELSTFVAKMLDQPLERRAMAERALQAVATQRGGTSRTVKLLMDRVFDPTKRHDETSIDSLAARAA